MPRTGATAAAAAFLTVAAIIAAMTNTAHGLVAPSLPTEEIVEPLIVDLDNNVPIDGVGLLEVAFPDDTRFHFANVLDVEIFPFKAILSRIVSCKLACALDKRGR